jgi:uncharacterized membrane protein
MTISQTHLHLEATLILVVSMLVASSSTLALLLLYLLVDATTLQDWAQHNQTIQQLSPTIRWSIAHLHLIAGWLLVMVARWDVSTAVGLTQGQISGRAMAYGCGWRGSVLWSMAGILPSYGRSRVRQGSKHGKSLHAHQQTARHAGVVCTDGTPATRLALYAALAQ